MNDFSTVFINYSDLTTLAKEKDVIIKPNTVYYWKVKVWNNRNEVSSFSSTASFFTAGELVDYKNPSYPLQITEQRPVSIKENKGLYQIDFGKDAFSQLKLQLYLIFKFI